MYKFSLTGVCAAVLLTIATPALAHHPFMAEFDWKKPLSVKGTVTKLDWSNPHAFLYVDVKDSTGKTTTWKFEMGGPAALSRLGWEKTSLKPGDTVTVDAWQARDGGNVGSAKSIRLADGRELYAGSSFFDIQQQTSVPVAAAEPKVRPNRPN